MPCGLSPNAFIMRRTGNHTARVRGGKYSCQNFLITNIFAPWISRSSTNHRRRLYCSGRWKRIRGKTWSVFPVSGGLTRHTSSQGDSGKKGGYDREVAACRRLALEFRSSPRTGLNAITMTSQGTFKLGSQEALCAWSQGTTNRRIRQL